MLGMLFITPFRMQLTVFLLLSHRHFWHACTHTRLTDVTNVSAQVPQLQTHPNLAIQFSNASSPSEESEMESISTSITDTDGQSASRVSASEMKVLVVWSFFYARNSSDAFRNFRLSRSVATCWSRIFCFLSFGPWPE